MREPPLEMSMYFVTALELHTNEDHQPQADPPVKPTVRIEVEQQVPAEAPKASSARIRAVELTIYFENPGEEIAAYTGKITVWGQFDISEGYPAEKVDLLMKVTAASMLYGTARDLVATITGSAPWGRYLLPTVSFLPDTEETQGAKKDSIARR